MMKRSIFFLLGFTMLSFGLSAQDKMELTAKMPELLNGDKVILWNPIDKSTDSTIVKNNSFTFSKAMPEGGCTYILQVEKDPNLGMFIYLEPGKINIAGKGTGFKGANFTGDAFVSDWVAMEKALAGTFSNETTMDELKQDFEEAKKLGDQAAMNSIAAEYKLLEQKVVADAKGWIDSHLSSGTSVYLLNTMLTGDERLPATEKLDYLNKFTGRAQKSQLTATMRSTLTGTKVSWLGKQAPDFSQPDVNGKVASLKDFKGKYVLVDLWASWCTPCRKDIPKLKTVYEKYKDKNFTMVSVSLDADRAKWLEAMDQEKMPWTQLSDLKASENTVALAYKVTAIPAKFLIDPSGKIIGMGFSDDALDKQLELLLK